MEPNAAASVTDALVGLGLPGIVIIGLAYMALRFHKLYVEAQEARITEGQKCIQQMMEHASILERAARGAA